MYLVTGASGFIGKHLVDALTKRGQTIYCLVYRPAVADFQELVDEHRPPGPEALAFAHIMHGIHW